jgi:hypothetical protein
MACRSAWVCGLLSLVIGCSSDEPPGPTSTGGAAGAGGALAGASGSATTASGTSSGGSAAQAGSGATSQAGTNAGSTAGGAAGNVSAGGTSGSASGGGAGGGVEQPAEVEIASGQEKPFGIAIDAESVYWTNHDAGTIVKCPLTGCADQEPTALASDIGEPMGLAVDANSFYWMAPPTKSGDKAQVLKCPLTGCSAAPVKVFDFTLENRAVDVHVKDQILYYAAWPAFGSCPIDGCSAPTEFQRMPALAIDSNDQLLFVARNKGLISCSLDGCKNEKTLAMNVSPLGVAVDSTHVYFTAYDYFGLDATIAPGIARCPLAGCGSDAPEAVKAGDDISPAALAVNAKRIFFTNAEQGTVVSIAKPQ